MSKFDKSSFRKSYNRVVPYTLLPSWLHRESDPRLNELEYHKEVVTIDNYKQVMGEIDRSVRVAIDCETNGLCFEGTDIIGVSFSLRFESSDYKEDTVKSYYAPLNHFTKDSEREGVGLFTNTNVVSICSEDNLDKQLVIDLYDKLLERDRIFFFNAEFDLVQLKQNGFRDFKDLPAGRVIDVQDLVYLLDMYVPLEKNSLKKASEWFLGWKQPTFKDTLGDVDNFQSVSISSATPYACADTFSTLVIGERLLNSMIKNYNLFIKIGSQLSIAFPYWQSIPLNFDKDIITESVKTLVSVSTSMENSLFKEWGIANVNSSQQIVKVFEGYKKDTKVRTESGAMSVSKKVLEKVDWKFAKDLLVVRGINSMLSKVYESTLDRLNMGLPMRFKYFRCVAPTYRLSSRGVRGNKKDNYQDKYFSGLNIQAVPKPVGINRVVAYNLETKSIIWEPDILLTDPAWVTGVVESGVPFMNFRQAWLPQQDDHIVVNIDYSSIEMVVAGYLANERVWVDAWEQGQDLHERTGMAIYGSVYHNGLRKSTKITNFLTLYGGGAQALIPVLPKGSSLEDAEKFMGNYWQGLSSLKKFIDSTHDQVRSSGIIRNCYGLARCFRGFLGKGRGIESFALRQSVNYMIQSSCAVMMRLALCKFYNLQKSYQEGDLVFLASVHDAIAFSVKKSIADKVIKDVSTMMCNLNPETLKSAKIEVTPEIGDSYGCMFNVKLREDGIYYPDFIEEIKDTETLKDKLEVFNQSLKEYKDKVLTDAEWVLDSELDEE